MKKTKLYLIVALAALLMATLACGFGGGEETPTEVASESETSTQEDTQPPTEVTPTDVPAPQSQMGDEYRSENGGYAFAEIPGWQMEEALGIASLLHPNADEDLGPMVMMVGADNEVEITLDEAFAEFTAEMGADEGVEFSDPVDLTLAGVPARQVVITGDEAGTSMVAALTVAVPAPTRSLVVMAFSPADQWDAEVADLYDALVASISFFDPVALEFDLPEETADLVEVRQWASEAVASSEYSNPNWAATQATGAPDTYPECGDRDTAWASASSDGQDWLELTYAVPVQAAEVNIYQTYSPSQITLVELLDEYGTYHEVYYADPMVLDCPSILTIGVDGMVLDNVVGVRLTVDQSVLSPTSWNEIDAVELVGYAAESAEIPPAEEDEPAAVAFETPDYFLWRLGGEGYSPDGEQYFGHLGGLDMDRNGFIYVPDNLWGIWIFDTDGNFIERIDHDEFNNVSDVSIGWSGNIYAASWGNNSVFVMDPNGEPLIQIGGEEGNGPGQFGQFSPQALTVDLDENIYVLDDYENDAEEDLTRVQVFDKDGYFLYEFPIEEDFFAANDIEYSPVTEHLYLVGFVGGYILEYDLQGNLIGKIGEEALDFSGPYKVDMDINGNFYVSRWTPSSVVMLDPEGNLVAEWGIELELEDGSVPWPEGALAQPDGVAVDRDGTIIILADWSGENFFINAFDAK